MTESASANEVDVWERTKGYGGAPVQQMNRRLFMQLLSYECEGGVDPAQTIARVGEQLDAAEVAGVIYADMNNPRGFAVLTWSEDPEHFVTKVRPCLGQEWMKDFKPINPQTMIGRTYSTGYEPDLEYWLINRPIETVLNPDWPWAVWYPLRRSGAFEQLEDKDKGAILREHGEIGKAYGVQDLAHDVRLACHGLDGNDNEFVIGLLGKELHPLSHVVQRMRRTKQTSEYISQMGPFFVGHCAWRSRAK